MSIHSIPDRYLNTTIHIFRESTVTDEIGDLETSQSLAYASLKANVQPVSSQRKSETEFEIHGRVHIQTHVAYINRVEDSIMRDIHIGDIAYDQETKIRYLVLGAENWQAADVSIEDSHHIKILLKAISGMPGEKLEVKTTQAKAKIT